MFDRVVSLIPFELASPLIFVVGIVLIFSAVFIPMRKKHGLYFPLGFWRRRVNLQSRKLWTFSALMGTIVFLLAFSLADPSRQSIGNTASEYEKPVLIIMDVSGSMGGSYEKSLEVFREILQQDLRASIGLEIYSGDTYIARDFAPDISFLQDTLENEQEIQEISSYTETAKALALARARFAKESYLNRKFIILVTDLVDNLPLVAREMKADMKEGITLFGIIVAEDSEAISRIETLRGLLSPLDAQLVTMGDHEGIADIVSQIQNAQGSFLVRAGTPEKTSLLPFVLLSLLGLLSVSLFLSETVFRKMP